MQSNRYPLLVVIACIAVGFTSCKFPSNIAGAQADSATLQEETEDSEDEEKKEPDFITVQHILIGYKGSVPGKPISRSKDDAKKLAEQVFEQAKKKPDEFDAMVKKHTNDAHPGIYHMANAGQKGDLTSGDVKTMIFERGKMVGAFGNVGFKLEVGDVGMAPFDEKESPYGWHIIKRIK